ncbi:MAG: phosphohydrolase [Anaerococcus vaginalis]|nr:phosphohydrolase [Anaerococcus vaginalis]
MYKENYGNIPNKDKINFYLIEDNKNLGPWVTRSKIIGKSAKIIGKDLGLDEDIAFACGSLFDIGKKEKKNGLENNLKSFHILRNESYFFPAKIAISHSFILKDINSYLGEMNLKEKDIITIKNLLLSYSYTDYDKLIQVLDNSITDNYLGIEKKQEILKEKYGKIPFEDERLKKLKEYEKYFENKLKKPIGYYVNKFL